MNLNFLRLIIAASTLLLYLDQVCQKDEYHILVKFTGDKNCNFAGFWHLSYLYNSLRGLLYN